MPTTQEEAEELAFRRLYGDWQALDPAGTAAFMTDYPGEWWIVGGWAIEAFTRVPRRGSSTASSPRTASGSG